jgi:hypothetical protein
MVFPEPFTPSATECDSQVGAQTAQRKSYKGKGVIMRFSLLLLGTIFMAVSAFGKHSYGGEIGFVEDFALSANRETTLKQLIPGSDDFYYYHALHYLNTEQFDKVEKLLPTWIERHGHNVRVVEIKHRWLLLTYPQQPERTLKYLTEQLGLRFDHQVHIPGAKPNLPTQLDNKRISRESLLQREHSQHGALEGMEDAALDWLVHNELTPDRRRQLLARLQRSDYSELVKLVVADLNHVNSGGFGSMAIHRQLLLTQLEEVLKLKPELLNQGNFVNVYLTKLQPNPDLDWRHDYAVLGEYLSRLQTFVDRLAPVHNSLKAHVLYQRLQLARRQGKYDKGLFMAYIQLPRVAGYVNPKYLESAAGQNHRVDLNANFEPFTLLGTVGNDEPLVRDYLSHFFLEDTNTKEYEPWLNDTYLKHLFAETKIVNGLGDAEQWYSLLPPAQYQALKQRIDLEFVPTNQTQFKIGEPITLELDVKFVDTLLVKVYEINTSHFYRSQLKEIDTAINLDGLVANDEQTYQYTEPPLRRLRRRFDLKSITKPGVYVVDFIGNGKNSRALIRVGRLHYTLRNSAGGQEFTILNDQHEVVPKATLWLGGREYIANEQGKIAVPFSTAPSEQRFVLQAGELCSLGAFHHAIENYSLRAGFVVDRETLLTRKKANVLIRPQLLLNGVETSLKLLEDVRLIITSSDHNGISSSKEVLDFKIAENRETAYEFLVPPRLASLQFSLSAKVKNLSQGNKTDLNVSELFQLNQIDVSDKIEDLHLACYDGQYVLHLLGKTGEAKPSRAVRFSIKHRLFRQPLDLSLQTNEAGAILLGELDEIQQLTAIGPEETSHSWVLPTDRGVLPNEVGGKGGDTLELPYFGANQQPSVDEFSLLELRGGTFFANRFELLKLERGVLLVGPLPAGDFDLLYKQTGQHVSIKVADGKQTAGFAHSATRRLELPRLQPLGVAGVTTAEKEIKVKISNATKLTRVHVIATRFLPAYSAFDQLAMVQPDRTAQFPVFQIDSVYLSGRDIGDEARYILDRRLAPRLPGNMLARPSLLLNPWALRSTETGQMQTQAEQAMAAFGAAAPAAKQPMSGATADQVSNAAFANLDFFRDPSAMLMNLEPNADGEIIIPRDQLHDRQFLQLLIVDPTTTLSYTWSLPEQKLAFRDLRFNQGLDPTKNFIQQKQVTFVKAGEKLHLPDVTSSRFEVYDSLAKVYGLLATVSQNNQLREFQFITKWHKLSREEKQQLYSKYACHELHYFIQRKDPEFFREVVQVYLKNKKEKTFLDHWLVQNDVAPFRQPWAHGRLNIVERILLAQRLENEQQPTAQHVRDLFHLLPPDVERSNQLFGFAVTGSALEPESLSVLQEEILEKQSIMLSDELRVANGAEYAGGSGLAGRGAAPAAKAANRFRSLAEGEKKSEERQMRRESDAKELAKHKMDALADRDGVEMEFRKRQEALFRQVEKTQEYAENNYYHLPIEQQLANLVSVNAFWNDYASQAQKEAFHSMHFPHASRNFTEMMFVLSVLDLPFEAQPHDSKFEGSSLQFTAGSDAIVFHEEIKGVDEATKDSPILVSQNFFQANDRYRTIENERLDKYVSGEFIQQTLYGCQIVLTNPTSAPQKLEVLLQLPMGSLPVSNGQATKSESLTLSPFGTQTVEYFFYFPQAGKFSHYPVHVSKGGKLVAHAPGITFNVVAQPTRIDQQSWEYVSQQGTPESVIDYLKANNTQSLNLDKIAFRMQDPKFFERVTDLLDAKHHYHHLLWSYGVKHNVPARINEYLKHADPFVSQAGRTLQSPLLTIDPVARFTYQHLEYMPLVNARTHKFGKRQQIVNNRFFTQYHELLAVLSTRRDLSSDDLLAITYYLLLQDRIAEAQTTFARIEAAKIATKMQYDYCAAYLDMFHDEPQLAKAIAMKYANYPVDRWRNAFGDIAAHLAEISGEKERVLDPDNREQQQALLAAQQPTFDFRVEGTEIKLTHRNLSSITVNYYVMDIEVLFSRNPFVQEVSGGFAHIRPNVTATMPLDAAKNTTSFQLPESLRTKNVLLEIVAGGKSQAKAVYAHSLNVQIAENYGQLRVDHATTGKPLSKTYVKVYAQMSDGEVKFYKDGYTDLRGKFDYTSLSTNDLDNVQKFSVLIMNDESGAMVREIQPPKR